MSANMDFPEGAHPLYICEGSCERVVLDKLLAADALVFPSADTYAITGRKKPDRIQSEYLNFDFDWPVVIVRLLDSRKENFTLDPLYASRFQVINIYTRPEIEMLTIINEGKYQDYTRKHKSKMKPSEYCKVELGMSQIKTTGYVEEYWKLKALVSAIKRYKNLSRLPKKELCLADLLREGVA